MRSRPLSAALMAKFIAASSTREWTPAWAVPCGLQASWVGVHDARTQPRSSPSTPYSKKLAPTRPMISMPPSPSQRSMFLRVFSLLSILSRFASLRSGVGVPTVAKPLGALRLLPGTISSDDLDRSVSFCSGFGSGARQGPKQETPFTGRQTRRPR